MIRDIKFADIHAVTRFIEACHERTHYAKNGIASLNIPEAKRLIGAGIGRHGHETGGGCWLQVSENDGEIDGLIYASLYRVCSVYDKLFASCLFWLASNPEDKQELMQSMLVWAKNCPHVIEVMVGPNAIADERDAGPLLGQLGMQEYGTIYRLEFVGERQCSVASSAELPKSSPQSQVALPN